MIVRQALQKLHIYLGVSYMVFALLSAFFITWHPGLYVDFGRLAA